MRTVRKEFDEGADHPRSRKNRLGNMRWFFIASCVAIGFVLGLALALIFFVWAVPPFVRPTNESTPWALIELNDKLSQWIIALTSMLATAVSALAVYFVRKTLDESTETNRIAAQAYAVDSAPFLVLKPIEPDTFRLDSKGYPASAIVCEIENTGKGPATVTSIFRSWQSTEPRGSPTPVEAKDSINEKWKRKRILFPVGPGGCSPRIHGLSTEYKDLKEEYKSHTKPTNWMYYVGYITYKTALSNDRFISGFCYVFRPDQPELGLHVAFPETGTDKYWYHKRDVSPPAASV